MRKVALLCVLSMFPLSLQAQSVAVRPITGADHTAAPIHTRLRFTTLVELPAGEDVVSVMAGDAAGWTVTAVAHTAQITPQQAGAKTNLFLVGASGTIYGFLLTESDKTAPDLRVQVRAPAGTRVAGTGPPVKFYTAPQVEALQAQVTAAQAAEKAAQAAADETVKAALARTPFEMRFVYEVPYTRPFLVRAMWHDATHTYIKSDARELPAIYAVKDGKPALVDFQVPVSSPTEGSTYVVPTVLDRGYFQMGKARLHFAARDADGD